MLFIEVPLVGLCGLDHLQKGCGAFEFLSAFEFMSKSVCCSFVEKLSFFRFPIKVRTASTWFCFKGFVIFNYLEFYANCGKSGVICKVLQVLCQKVFRKANSNFTVPSPTLKRAVYFKGYYIILYNNGSMCLKLQ